MTRHRALELGWAAMIMALVAGLAWLHGRYSAPTQAVRETVAERKAEAQEATKAAEATSTRQAAISLQGAVVTRWRTLPGPGPCAPATEVERIEVQREERTEATAAKAASAETARASSSSDASRVLAVTEYRRARWALGLDGGLRLSSMDPVVTGRVEMRVLGPLWLAAWGGREAVGLGARLEW
jgi:hypothetical protein